MLNKIIAEESVQQVCRLLEKREKIVITCHVSPDGDAIGSALGLYHFLDKLGKEVNVVIPDMLPRNLLFLRGSKETVVYTRYPEFAEKLMAEAELIFCLDFNVLARIDRLQKAVETSTAKKVLIDHHLHPGKFCDVVISHPEIASTSELIFRLICQMGMFDRIPLNSAEAIYTGMMTDTGNFTYNSNSPEIYYIIAELVKLGINKDYIYAMVYNNNTADKVRLNGYAVNEKMELFPEYKAALITLTRDEMSRYNYHKGDSEGLVNVPLSIEGIRFAIFLREERDFIKVSMRSKGFYPTNKVAAEQFGGGGHLNASGGEFRGTMEEAQELVRKILIQYNKYMVKDKD